MNIEIKMVVYMNIFKMSSIVILSSLAWQCFAGEKIEQSLPAANVNNVSIENLRGDVRIIGWDQDKVTVSGELDEQAERLVFEQQGSSITIKVVVPRHTNNDSNVKGSHLIINVPKNSRVNFSGVSSDVFLEKLINSSEVNTVSGNIEAKNLSENIDLNTVSGDIDTSELSGKIRLASVSGDIKDHGSKGRVQFKAVSGGIKSTSNANEIFINNVSGNIDLVLDKVDELVISTVSGDIESTLHLNDKGVVKLSSVSGDMEMSFTDNVQADFRLQASSGGRIINKLTAEKAQEAKYGPSSQLYFQTGNGSASVRAHTVSGTMKMSNK